MNENTTPRALALFSGGLDSILAAKVVEEQGINVTCLHFTSPFFGHPRLVKRWESLHRLRIVPVDISPDFTAMLARRPEHGFGSVLNPCMDCKILMLRKARAFMDEMGASCLVSGEVLGQRPMSQRRDALNVIRRDAGVRDVLIRPLCALRLDPTEPELSGLVDRSRLLGISGRGRKDQMALAERYQLKEIPTPGGGCKLTEQESARRYWPLLSRFSGSAPEDFVLADTGRQFWLDAQEPRWLIIGRNQADNDAIMSLAGPEDLVLKVREFPGPLGLARLGASAWSADEIRLAAAQVASYSPKASRHAAERGETVAVRAYPGHLDNPGSLVDVRPERLPVWKEPSWAEARDAVKAEARERAGL